MYDVIVIGAGVTGSSIARELARTERRIAVLEAASDVCEGTSKANSGIVHAGHDAVPGSLKAKLNIEGNAAMEALSHTLDFPFLRNGSLVLCFQEEDMPKLMALYEKGMKNGVPDLTVINNHELKRLEPAVTDHALAALYAPTGGIVCPFGLTIAMAENAAVNGVEFYLNQKVTEITALKKGYRIRTQNGSIYEAELLINAAGAHADEIHNMLPDVNGHGRIELTARKGEYCLYDKQAGSLVEKTIFQLPGVYGKGILVTPTVHGNLLIGPTAVDIPLKDGVNTTQDGLCEVLKKAAYSVEKLPSAKQIITSFAGIRAHHESDDFVIQESTGHAGFLDVAGIESPGLTCAPAIGKYVADMVQSMKKAPQKETFIERRRGIHSMEYAGLEERKAMIAQNPAYANIVCRCESISEGEILEAIHRPLGATTLDGVKRRVRAGMGRCQGGFCAPKVTQILARELGMDMEDVRKSGQASVMLYGYTKKA